LCQLTAEIEDHSICSHRVHLQFYGYNDLYVPLMRAKLGFLAHPLGPVLKLLSRRLFVIFGYLHSAVSSSIRLVLSGGSNSAVRLEGMSNPESLRICHTVARKLLRNRNYFEAIPLLAQLRLDLPGGGYRSGGTFPMRAHPGSLDTDRWGSLQSLPGGHLVDASILPSVPAAPTSFTVMANAHRIATQVELSDED
jgi:hypothetical protein